MNKPIYEGSSFYDEVGFEVAALREADPKKARFSSEETFQRRQRIPLFLIMAGRKPF
jgi:hypothetical protein